MRNGKRGKMVICLSENGEITVTASVLKKYELCYFTNDYLNMNSRIEIC